jgi:hypothetical protein
MEAVKRTEHRMSLDVYLEVVVDTGAPEPHCVDLYWANITHNLGDMAAAAGIYLCLWRPDEIDITTAGQLVEPLTEGLALLEADPARFEAFNAPNGWGTYKHFVPFVRQYLEACKQHPKALVRVSR